LEAFKMATIRVSSKGQVVLPKSVRDAHGWRAGTELEVFNRDDEVVLRPKVDRDERFPPITIQEFLAMSPKVPGPPITDEEIREVVLREAGRRFDAKRR
jgi:AbrB family looped-hinge helix DNA binding protein